MTYEEVEQSRGGDGTPKVPLSITQPAQDQASDHQLHGAVTMEELLEFGEELFRYKKAANPGLLIALLGLA